MYIIYNKQTFGPVYHNMRVCRARFKYALRYMKHIEDTARADALAKDFCDYDNDEFWKGVKKLNQSNNIQANCIEGKTGEKDIANHWKEYFCKLLNNNAINETLKDSIMGKLEGIQYTETIEYTPKKLRKQSVNSKRGSFVDPMVAVLKHSRLLIAKCMFCYHCVFPYVSWLCLMVIYLSL